MFLRRSAYSSPYPPRATGIKTTYGALFGQPHAPDNLCHISCGHVIWSNVLSSERQLSQSSPKSSSVLKKILLLVMMDED